jgi:hypothetical protein
MVLIFLITDDWNIVRYNTGYLNNGNTHKNNKGHKSVKIDLIKTCVPFQKKCLNASKATKQQYL